MRLSIEEKRKMLKDDIKFEKIEKEEDKKFEKIEEAFKRGKT